jgi:hypothetical protein
VRLPLLDPAEVVASYYPTLLTIIPTTTASENAPNITATASNQFGIRHSCFGATWCEPNKPILDSAATPLATGGLAGLLMLDPQARVPTT